MFNLGGPRIGVDEIVAAIERLEPWSRGRITFEERFLPFPEAFDGGPIEAALGVQPRTSLRGRHPADDRVLSPGDPGREGG